MRGKGFEFNFGARFFPQSACLFLPRPSPFLLYTPIGVFSLFPHCGNWQRRKKKKKTYIPPFLLFLLSLDPNPHVCAFPSRIRKKKKKSTIVCTPGEAKEKYRTSGLLLMCAYLPKGRVGGCLAQMTTGKYCYCAREEEEGVQCLFFFIALFFCAKMREAE